MPRPTHVQRGERLAGPIDHFTLSVKFLQKSLLALFRKNWEKIARRKNQKGMPEVLSCGGPFRQ
jgi:hypothetical protein